MIFTAILELLYRVLMIIPAVLGEVNAIPALVGEGIYSIVSVIAPYDWLFPIREIFIVIFWAIVFETGMLTLRFSLYIVKLIRGHG